MFLLPLLLFFCFFLFFAFFLLFDLLFFSGCFFVLHFFTFFEENIPLFYRFWLEAVNITQTLGMQGSLTHKSKAMIPGFT